MRTVDILNKLNHDRCFVGIENDPDGRWHAKVGKGFEATDKTMRSALDAAYKAYQFAERTDEP
jgi:hypothetical protein